MGTSFAMVTYSNKNPCSTTGQAVPPAIQGAQSLSNTRTTVESGREAFGPSSDLRLPLALT